MGPEGPETGALGCCACSDEPIAMQSGRGNVDIRFPSFIIVAMTAMKLKIKNIMFIPGDILHKTLIEMWVLGSF